MTWASTHKTRLHKLNLKQKHANRLIYYEDKFTHTKPPMQSLQVLNVLQINIQKILVIMHHVETCSDVPSIFPNRLPILPIDTQHISEKNNFAIPKYLSHKSKYKISIRGSLLWNKVLSSTEKELQETSLFKAKLKSNLLKMDDKVKYF